MPQLKTLTSAHLTMSLPSNPASSQSPTSAPRHARWVLALICFLAGASVMVIEISANRLLAPLFGNSAYTWTALIGVILIAFSVGGYLGGWLAERKPGFELLGWLLSGAAVLTLFVPVINVSMAGTFANSGLIAGPLGISLVLFALPGVLLGAVSPVSLRLLSSLAQDTQIGFAAGLISMLGSLGSFVGTLLTGFYLLSSFGVKAIFMGTGIALLLLGAAAFVMARNTLASQAPTLLSGLLALGFAAMASEPATANVLWEQETFYHRLQVIEQGKEPHAERFLHLDSTLEGGMKVRDGSVVLNYQQFWQLPTMKPDFKPKRALFIGAGAFAMPEQLSKHYPEAVVDVIEIDPAVIEAGERFFKLKEFPNVHAYPGDARRFLLAQSEGQYDFIFGDAYNGIRQIPVHLCSKEFFQLIHSRLSSQGIYLMNVISAVEGPRAELLAGMMKTLEESFPKLDLFCIGGSLAQIQNVLLLASNESWRPLFTDSSYAVSQPGYQIARCFVPTNRWPQGGVIFTDDLNPVDRIIGRSLWQE
jgi:spermidine synthase